MANTFKTLSDGDIVREALALFHNESKFLKTINKQYDNRFAREGAKNGGSLLIRNPNQYEVTTGAVMTAQDQAETTQTLTVATQKHIGMNFTSVEQTMSVDDFRERYLKPAMSRLAADVEYTCLNAMYKDVFNLTGTPATTPASLLAVLNAGARLSQNLAPTSDRSILFDSTAMAATVNGIGTYFHKSSEVERGFSTGALGHAGGFDFYESNMVPSHTNGSRDDTTPVIDTSTLANGDTTITTTGADGTMKAGDVFTIEGVYAVNLETKQAYSHLQQFVITADKTNDATDVWAVAPTIYISGAKKNVSVTSAGAGKAIVNVAAGGSGAASTAYTQNLAYHRDAFTFVSADLYKMPNETMTSAVIDNVSMRLWKGSDIVNDKFPVRLDVLFGYKTLRPEWAVRVRG